MSSWRVLLRFLFLESETSKVLRRSLTAEETTLLDLKSRLSSRRLILIRLQRLLEGRLLLLPALTVTRKLAHCLHHSVFLSRRKHNFLQKNFKKRIWQKNQ